MTNISPYVVMSGQWIAFFAIDGNGMLAPITSVSGTPAVVVNGSPAVAIGPYWFPEIPNYHQTPVLPFVGYLIPGGLQPTDVVTFSSPAAWITSPAGPSAAIVTAPIFNSVGQLEPAQGGYLPFDLPPAMRTMQIGYQLSWPSSQPWMPYNANRNWLVRTYNPWAGALTSTPDGQPLTFTGMLSAQFASNTNGNGVDGRHHPVETGTWTITVDDDDTITPLQFGITGNACAAISPAGIGPPNASPGQLVGGVLRRQIWQISVSRASGADWNLNLSIIATKPGVKGVMQFTAANLGLYSPVETDAAAPGYPDQLDPLGPDRAIVNMVTTPSGKGPATIRLQTGDYTAYSSVIDADDLLSPSDFSWNARPQLGLTPTGGRKFNVIAVRPYDLTVSPCICVSVWNHPTGLPVNAVRLNSGGSSYTAPTVTAPGVVFGTPTVANGVITSIPVISSAPCLTPPPITIVDATGTGAIAMPVAAVAPPSVAFGMNGGGGWYCGEAVTDVPHNLKTGQLLLPFVGSSTFNVSSGTAATVTGVSLANAGNVVAWVTAPNTFAFYGWTPKITANGVGLPGGLNNVVGTQTVAYATGILLPTRGTKPYDACAQIAAELSGCGLHIMIPPPTSDACASVIAETICDILPPGRQLLIEYGDEPWNTSGVLWLYTMGAGNLGVFGPAAQTAGSTIRTAQIHQIFADVFTAAGRGGDIVRCFGSQFGNAAVTAATVKAINAYNAPSPAVPIQFDRLMVAPYPDMPTTAKTPISIPMAAASLAGSNPLSIANPGAGTVPLDGGRLPGFLPARSEI